MSEKKENFNEITGETAVFLDRDGTINSAGTGQYITRWQQFEFLPGVPGALAALAKLPVKIFVVTNQSAVHRDMMTVSDLELIHGRMEFEIVSAGGRIDGLKYCPHAPREKCYCRKPKSLLFSELAKEHALELKNSFNVGDHTRDMQAGHVFGMTNILVRTGLGKMSEMSLKSSEHIVDHVVDDLPKAVEIIESILNERAKL
ncbi:MAG: HAD-IIIA family hydrolase [bacterium]